MGIDPGTTSSYAVIDTNGNIISVRSAKEMDLSQILFETCALGTVICVGTDKKNVPSLVEKYAIRTGARLSKPSEDMAAAEKTAITRAHKLRNDHERDALACAITAYNDIKQLLDKIKTNTQLTDTDLANRVTKLVVTKGISINSAIMQLTETKTEKPVKIEMSPAIEKDPAIKTLEKENALLKKHNQKLIRALEKNKSKIKKLRTAVPVERPNFKDRTIDAISAQLANKEAHISKLKMQLATLQLMIASSKDRTLIKKLKNLTWEQFNADDRILKIRQNDVLLVKNADIYSERTLRELREKNITILYEKEIAPKIKEQIGLKMVNAARLNIVEEENFGLCDTTQLKAAVSEINILKNVIEDYRKERRETV